MTIPDCLRPATGAGSPSTGTCGSPRTSPANGERVRQAAPPCPDGIRHTRQRDHGDPAPPPDALPRPAPGFRPIRLAEPSPPRTGSTRIRPVPRRRRNAGTGRSSSASHRAERDRHRIGSGSAGSGTIGNVTGAGRYRFAFLPDAHHVRRRLGIGIRERIRWRSTVPVPSSPSTERGPGSPRCTSAGDRHASAAVPPRSPRAKFVPAEPPAIPASPDCRTFSRRRFGPMSYGQGSATEGSERRFIGFSAGEPGEPAVEGRDPAPRGETRGGAGSSCPGRGRVSAWWIVPVRRVRHSPIPTADRGRFRRVSADMARRVRAVAPHAAAGPRPSREDGEPSSVLRRTRRGAGVADGSNPDRMTTGPDEQD